MAADNIKDNIFNIYAQYIQYFLITTSTTIYIQELERCHKINLQHPTDNLKVLLRQKNQNTTQFDITNGLKNSLSKFNFGHKRFLYLIQNL